MRRLLIIITCLLGLFTSCNKIEKPHYDIFNHTIIMTCLGHNNLSSYMTGNLDDLCTGILPPKESDKAIVVFAHQTRDDARVYSDDVPPVLFRIYRESGKLIYDTLIVYPKDTRSASAEVINTALKDIQRLVPSKSYGMVFSSHATAWLPEGYKVTSSVVDLNSEGESFDPDFNYGFPLTKTMGAFYFRKGGSTYTEEINIKDFVDAIPMHLDYFISDACLMSSIEVIWDFKDICDYFLASPTEILAKGINYKTLSWNVFSGEKPDLKQIAVDYFELYNSNTGQDRSATVTLVDCKKVDALARSFSKIVNGKTEDIKKFDHSPVQRYFYNPNKLCFFYDLQDFVVKFGASAKELESFNKSLGEAVIYHAETPQFFENALNLINCCGLSVYIPDRFRDDLTAYYPNLSWSEATGYLRP